jgi:hypothetical protein
MKGPLNGSAEAAVPMLTASAAARVETTYFIALISFFIEAFPPRAMGSRDNLIS